VPVPESGWRSARTGVRYGFRLAVILLLAWFTIDAFRGLAWFFGRSRSVPAAPPPPEKFVASQTPPLTGTWRLPELRWEIEVAPADEVRPPLPASEVEIEGSIDALEAALLGSLPPTVEPGVHSVGMFSVGINVLVSRRENVRRVVGFEGTLPGFDPPLRFQGRRAPSAAAVDSNAPLAGLPLVARLDDASGRAQALVRRRRPSDDLDPLLEREGWTVTTEESDRICVRAAGEERWRIIAASLEIFEGESMVICVRTEPEDDRP
jgi:hypothetical protein